jgi:hypothetical protein
LLRRQVTKVVSVFRTKISLTLEITHKAQQRTLGVSRRKKRGGEKFKEVLREDKRVF